MGARILSVFLAVPLFNSLTLESEENQLMHGSSAVCVCVCAYPKRAFVRTVEYL